jgi:hypothetical protein
MPEMMRHMWMLFVAVTAANALGVWRRSRSVIAARPEKADGYQQLIRGVLFWGNLPWLVMGLGIELGAVDSVFAYFRPMNGNPYVLAWFVVVISEWLLGAYWIVTRRGAEFLFEHPGLLQGEPESPAAIRTGYCLIIAGSTLGLFLMFMMDPSRL